jgi:hypothetical protein
MTRLGSTPRIDGLSTLDRTRGPGVIESDRLCDAMQLRVVDRLSAAPLDHVQLYLYLIGSERNGEDATGRNRIIAFYRA